MDRDSGRMLMEKADGSDSRAALNVGVLYAEQYWKSIGDLAGLINSSIPNIMNIIQRSARYHFEIELRAY